MLHKEWMASEKAAQPENVASKLPRKKQYLNDVKKGFENFISRPL
jgi:hypothetical protein